MDAGLAAVLGALAGSVATIGAALATGWSAREQGKLAARAEHLRQRRDARQAIYEEFIAAVQAHSELTKFLQAPVPQDLDDLARLRILPEGKNLIWAAEESNSLYSNVRSLATRVQLAGPQEVSAAAYSVNVKCRQVSGVVEVLHIRADYPGGSLRERWTDGCTRFVRLSRLLEEFSEIARQALDDDGTRK
ncbi:hypothetical protein ABZ235_09815 [Streptomyces canus]|uniref:hypothetical protein n=1 Tax=Streptomyces canus TaxID=58343 RepID=UPI0033AE98CF